MSFSHSWNAMLFCPRHFSRYSKPVAARHESLGGSKSHPTSQVTSRSDILRKDCQFQSAGGVLNLYSEASNWQKLKSLAWFEDGANNADAMVAGQASQEGA